MTTYQFSCQVDGGTDENLPYEEAIACAIELFCSCVLDGIFNTMNATGMIAFNRVGPHSSA